MNEKGESGAIEPTRIESSIIEVRNQRVILDSDLAGLYGVETKRLNEQVKRNAAKFDDGYAFRLTKEEVDDLRSQSATSNQGRGGRRYPPWAFTEHGVVMAATILDSVQAVEASKLIVGVFVEVRHRFNGSEAVAVVPSAAGEPTPLGKLAAGGHGIVRLQRALDHVLDSVIDSEKQKTVRDEARHIITESIQSLKDRLRKQGLENAEIEARVVKLLAEAEKEKAVAARTRVESDKLEFAVIVSKLRLLLEAQRAMEQDRMDGFLDVLREMDN
jgi:hypothetical protein